MANITLPVSEELKNKMEQFPEINWSEVARQTIKEKAVQLAILKAIATKSKLTEKDALELGRKVNKGLARRYRGMM
jgi:L-aminopeptidase/D-esterase-like protein